MLVVSVTMVVSVLAAFSLARMKFWGSATLATGVFLTYLIPETLLFIPLFKIFATIHDLTGIELINHWWVLIVVYPTLTVPFATWIMIGYFSSIPKELDEAALIDGAGYLQILTEGVHPGGAARDHRGDDLCLYRVVGEFPLSARLHDLGRPARHAGRLLSLA